MQALSISRLSRCALVFFFNVTATTEIYTLSLHDALPISRRVPKYASRWILRAAWSASSDHSTALIDVVRRSEEHTSELQSQSNLVCRLLLEKKKKTRYLDKSATV